MSPDRAHEFDVSELPFPLQLRPSGEHRFAAPNSGDAETRDVVFGGQLLAQMIMAAHLSCPEKKALSIHTLFSRAARVSAPTEIHVETMADGRTFRHQLITVWQGDRLCARALLLSDVEESDVMRHADPMPVVGAPEDAPVAEHPALVMPGAELRIVGGVDTWDPGAPTGPPELFVWTRSPGLPDNLTISHAALAWATDGFLIGAAMLPHAGIGQRSAHQGLSTGVVSHSVTFHEPFDARRWLLIANRSVSAGRGRSFGEAAVYDEAGTRVASVAQTAMIRRFTRVPARPREKL